MKQKLIEWMNSRHNNSHAMRLLAGGYVVYLGADILKSQANAGSFRLGLTLCAILLLLLGLPVALISLYAVLKGYGTESKGNPDTADREPENGSDPE